MYDDAAPSSTLPGGPAIDIVINFGGGCYRCSQQHILGGAIINIFINFGGGCYRCSR
jgi:hypothetical protein